jgi:hypothetical protein
MAAAGDARLGQVEVTGQARCTVAASTNAHSRRCASASAPRTSAAAWPSLARRGTHGGVHDRPQLDPAAGGGALPGEALATSFALDLPDPMAAMAPSGE